jgi:hypothetical protein
MYTILALLLCVIATALLLLHALDFRSLVCTVPPETGAAGNCKPRRRSRPKYAMRRRARFR